MKFFSVLLLSLPLFAGIVTVPSDKPYQKMELESAQIIYPDSLQKAAAHTAEVAELLKPAYEKMFGYALDERLFVGLLSEHNQNPNGFSTQFPFNMQMNYIGGTSHIDYFCSTSWLDTLLQHETAHNYQVNAKKSAMSRVAHDYLGNLPVPLFLGPVPLFVVPNALQPSFLLEGNAVLNESWHGNGGRLYSGRFKAETLMQARASLMTPYRQFNQHLFFPYGEHHYIVGGFFQLYLAETYGLDTTNRYFYNNSVVWVLPLFTSAVFSKTFGVSFRQAFRDFEQWLQPQLKEFTPLQGEVLHRAKQYTPLNSDDEEIFFLTGNALRAPELVVLEKSSHTMTTTRGSWAQGKLYKAGGKYLSVASRMSSPTRLTQGLYDREGYLLQTSRSKVVQGFMRDGTAVYFDVNRSFDQAQLYVGEMFFAQVNSSVFVDRDDHLYYFKQKGKTRTLYRDALALTSIEGWYGFVTDVDAQGRIYVIANTKTGTSLYRFNQERWERLSQADNVIDARLIDETTLLLVAIGAEDYSYVKAPIEPTEEAPFATTLFMEKEPYYNSTVPTAKTHAELPKPTAYSPLGDLHFSSLYPSIGYGSEAGLLFSFDLTFQDPLMQNRFNLFARRDINKMTLGGAAYSNSENRLEFGLSAYGVLEHDTSVVTRGYGGSAYVNYPLYRSGYLRSDAILSYAIEHESKTREPLTFTLDLSRSEQYSQSYYINYLSHFKLFGSYDRDDLTAGASYDFAHDLPYEFYVGFGAKGVKSDAEIHGHERGIKLTGADNPYTYDTTTVLMPSLSGTHYITSAQVGEVSLKKVFNLNAYFFTFPVSLRREALYGTYRYYRIDSSANTNITFNEATAGLSFDLLFINQFPLPVNVEYLYNDNLSDKEKFRFYLGMAF